MGRPDLRDLGTPELAHAQRPLLLPGVHRSTVLDRPSDLSLLHVLAYAASNGGLEKALATTDGAQQDRIVGGSARLAERMADGLDVRLNSEVDTVAKVFAAYPTGREDGLTGQVAADAGPVKITFDVSPPGAEIGVLLGFVEAGEARRWQRLDAQQRRQVLECFSTYVGPRAENPSNGRGH